MRHLRVILCVSVWRARAHVHRCPRWRSQPKQPYSDQPRFRRTLNRRTATAYAGFPGAQVQRSCTFAPGNPGLGYLPRHVHSLTHSVTFVFVCAFE